MGSSNGHQIVNQFAKLFLHDSPWNIQILIVAEFLLSFDSIEVFSKNTGGRQRNITHLEFGYRCLHFIFPNKYPILNIKPPIYANQHQEEYNKHYKGHFTFNHIILESLT